MRCYRHDWNLARFFGTGRFGRAKIAGPNIDGALRFYDRVSVVEILSERPAYSVALDGRNIKTSLKSKFEVPYRALVYAVAHEWDAQKTTIRPATMPIMTLASTIIDLHLTSSRHDLIEDMMNYLQSDTICYQVSPTPQEKLYSLQLEKWEPIRRWFEKKFDGELDVSHGTIDALVHDETLVHNVRLYLQKLNDFELVPLRAMTRNCKSFITASALFDRHITAKDVRFESDNRLIHQFDYDPFRLKAMDISRVEEEFQIGSWGLVEGGHDLDRVNCCVGISSASSFLWLQQQMIVTIPKNLSKT